MPLLALGVDVSTTQAAMGVLDHTGYYQHRLVKYDTSEQGARRLMQVRQAVGGALDAAGWDLSVAAVEVPRILIRLPGGKVRVTDFALESCAAVALEVIQSRYRHLIVLDPTPSVWQRDTIGSGKDAKARSLVHANALGLATTDDNISDSLCIAEYARELYLRDVLEEVA